MQIQILAVGKVKEKYLNAGMAEYLKRLAPYAKIQIHEVKDEKTTEGASPAEEEILLQKEASRLESLIKPGSYVIALAIDGKSFSSPEFAARLDALATTGKCHITFIIGGSRGLAPRLQKKSGLTVFLLPDDLSPPALSPDAPGANLPRF